VNSFGKKLVGRAFVLPAAAWLVNCQQRPAQPYQDNTCFTQFLLTQETCAAIQESSYLALWDFV
jgi:hypothetical protein